MANSTSQQNGFYRWEEVAQQIPISKPVWWKGVKNGRYPRQYRLSDNTVGWLKEDIHLLIEYIKEYGTPPAKFKWASYKASVITA